MNRSLVISSKLKLSRQAVTETMAILGKRGVGKTHTAVVFAEELLKNDLPVVIIDPIGVWYGLRSSKSGKMVGYPITVFGGEHADVPLEVSAGKYIAKLVAEEHVSCILDLSLFRKGERKTFITDFAEELYRLNREPLQVIIDEADSFAPQKVMHGEERMLGAIDDLVRRGRARGLGVCLVTQRTAVINKNVLSQVEMLIVLRTLAPQDRKAIEGWTDVHGEEEKTKRMMGSLPKLPKGHAWVWWPEKDVFDPVEIRERETFDSSATPRVGVRLSRPKKLAPIDLEKIHAQMRESIERAKQEDPKELRKTIAQLTKRLDSEQKDLSGVLAGMSVTKRLEWFKYLHRTDPVLSKFVADRVNAGFDLGEQAQKTVEVSVLKPADIKRLEAVANQWTKAVESLVHRSQNIGSEAEALTSQIRRLIEEVKHPMVKMTLPKRPSGVDESVKAPPAKSFTVGAHVERDDLALIAGERKILEALASVHPGCRTRTQVGTLAGYTASGGTFSNYFGRLRKNNLIEVDVIGNVKITGEGLDAAGIPVGVAPIDPEEIRKMWLSKLNRGEKVILEMLISVHPSGLEKEHLGAETGYTASGGTFSNYLGTLRRNALIRTDNEGVIYAAGELF